MELMQAHQQWAKRPDDECYENLIDLKNAVDNRRKISKQRNISFNAIKAIGTDQGLTLETDRGNAIPTHYAFGQMCVQLGIPAGYLREIPSELAALNLNHGLTSKGREVETKMLAAVHDDYTEVRAFTGVKYGRIWDSEVVELAEHAVERSNGKFHNPPSHDPRKNGLYASDRDCFIFMIDGGSQLEAGPRAHLNRGFFLWNSETGSATFGCMIFYFNSVCGNHIVWGAQNVQKLVVRHSKYGPYRFEHEGLPMLLKQANESMAPMEATVRKAQTILLPKPEVKSESTEEVLLDYVKKVDRTFTKGEVREAIEYAKNEEGQCITLWDLVQGFTASARDYAYTDARVKLETRAGNLLKLAA